MLAVLALVPLALVILPPAAGAASTRTRTLPPTEAEAVTAPPHLTVPADGRLRGTGFTATVTGVGWPASATSHHVATVAPAGDRLIVVTLRLTEPTADLSTFGTGNGATANVAAAGRTVPVDLALLDQQIEGATTTTGTGTETFALSVPAHAHRVVLSLARNGFAQRLDLWTLRRIQPSPTVLYRDPTSATVTAGHVPSTTLTATNPADGFSSAATLGVESATLTYFAPDGSGTTPGTPGKAFVAVHLAATVAGQATPASPTWGHYLSSFAPLPGTRLTFTPAGGTPASATSAPQQGTTGNPATDDGLLDADYWFIVPASLTSGTVTVTPGPVTGVEFTGFVGTGSVPLELPTATTLEVTFPAPGAAPAAQRTPPWVGAPLPATGTAAGTTGAAGSAGGSGGFPVWLAVVIVAGLVVAAVLGERVVRRRRAAAAGEAQVTAAVAAPPEERPVGPAAPVVGTPVVAARGAPATAEPPALGSSRRPRGPGLGARGRHRVGGPTERRGTLCELCCYLALHPERPRTTAELLAALWPVNGERGEATPKTLHNHLSRLRQAVGAEHLPDAVAAGGYRLQGAVTDWAEWSRLTAEAAGADGEAADRLRARALALVRGTPFDGAPGDQYGWAFASGLATAMTVAVGDCARQLSTSRLDAGDGLGAEDSGAGGAARCARGPPAVDRRRPRRPHLGGRRPHRQSDAGHGRRPRRRRGPGRPPGGGRVVAGSQGSPLRRPEGRCTWQRTQDRRRGTSTGSGLGCPPSR